LAQDFELREWIEMMLTSEAQLSPPCSSCKGLKAAAAAQHVGCLKKHLDLKGSGYDVDSKLSAQLLLLAADHSREERNVSKEKFIEPDCAGCLRIVLQLENLSTTTLSKDSATNPLCAALQQAASGDCVRCSRLILDWFNRNEHDLFAKEWERAVEAAVWRFSLNTLKLMLIAAPADIQTTLQQAALQRMCRSGHRGLDYLQSNVDCAEKVSL
jgi:hypothetical protein